MKAAYDNPIYTVYLVIGGDKYNITPAVMSLDFSSQEQQIAASVTITTANIKVGNSYLSTMLKVRQRVFIYANDGSQNKEVFRGWTWTKYYESENESKEIRVKCYDNLIYLQESEDSFYFTNGTQTKSIMTSICSEWGISLNYNYESISHDKLALRGTLSDMIMSDILDVVKKRSGKKYVITSQQDVMTVSEVGTNTKVYSLTAKNNATLTRSETTMDGMVTQVKILGDAEKDSEKIPVLETVKGNTSTYGTLQKLQDKNSDTSLADAKTEAQNTINDDGTPKKEYYVDAIDIPWILKGDKVYVNAGDIKQKNLIVTGIDRDISNKKKRMSLTLKEP